MASKRSKPNESENISELQADTIDLVSGKMFACIQTLHIIRGQLSDSKRVADPGLKVIVTLLESVIKELEAARRNVPGRVMTARDDLASVE